MRCDECQQVIEEYFDGELNEQSGLEVRRHLDLCPSCAGTLQNLRAEQSVYLGYESEVEVRPELWAGVRARIASGALTTSARPLTRLHRWLTSAFTLPQVSGAVAAGLVILAIGLTVAVMRYVSGTRVEPTSVSVQSSPTAIPSPPEEQAVIQPVKERENPRNGLTGPENIKRKRNIRASAVAGNRRPPSRMMTTIGNAKTPDQLVREAEQKYLAAIAMLSRSVERRRSRLDAATLARLEQALASVDRTIAATRKVVRRHPDDPVAVQFMLTAYARKVDVLREMVDY